MPRTDPDQILADPQWLAHRFDAPAGKVIFAHLPRSRHAAIPFLTDEHLGKALETTARPLAAPAAPPAPVHFIFHSAFCCSTLLVRALDHPGAAMGLSEPTILNDIVGWRHRNHPDGVSVVNATRTILHLLGRSWGAGEAVVIKPSNLLNPMASVLMQLATGSRAILLHAPLPVFIASIARKDMWGRLWVRDLLVKLLREGVVNLGIEGAELLKLTDLQVAAVGWLAQQMLFEQMAKAMPRRIRTLDSETLLARPADSVLAAARLFGLSIDAAAAAAIAAGPAFTRNSKTGEAFSAEARTAEHEQGLSLHHDEITMVSQWAAVVAERFNVPMHLSSPLLDRT